MNVNNRPQDEVVGSDVAAGHEPSDVSVAGIAWAGFGLAAVSIVMALLTLVLFRYFAVRDVPATPRPALESILPAEPRIQSNPGQEMEALRREEDRLVSDYRWLDQKRGIARIPVARAMRLLLERGLPVRGAAASSATPPDVSARTPADVPATPPQTQVTPPGKVP